VCLPSCLSRIVRGGSYIFACRDRRGAVQHSSHLESFFDPSRNVLSNSNLRPDPQGRGRPHAGAVTELQLLQHPGLSTCSPSELGHGCDLSDPLLLEASPESCQHSVQTHLCSAKGCILPQRASLDSLAALRFGLRTGHYGWFLRSAFWTSF
jgi:hypothetical protein